MARSQRTLAAMQTAPVTPVQTIVADMTKVATTCIVEFQRADDANKLAAGAKTEASQNVTKQREKLLRGIAAVSLKLGANDEMTVKAIDDAYSAKKPNDEKKMSSLKTWIGYLKSAASVGAREHVKAIFETTDKLWNKDENETLYRDAFVREQHMAIALIGQAALNNLYLDESAIRGYATKRAFDRKYSTKEAKRLIAATKSSLIELNLRFPFDGAKDINTALGLLDAKSLADRAKNKGPAPRVAKIENPVPAGEPAEGIYDTEDDDDIAAAMMAA